MMNLSELSQYYQQNNDKFPEPFRLRIYRSISWLNTAQQRLNLPEPDFDIAFITLWIAFNAAYAKEIDDLPQPERTNFQEFLQTVCGLDNEQKLYSLVWQKFSGSLRLLLDNRYVFQPFWHFHNGKIDETAWQKSFENAKRKSHTALAKKDTAIVLSIVFDRLYTLRNQLMHGGATFAGSANRTQLKDACDFLQECVPQIVAIMMTHPTHTAWGRSFYPFVQEA